MPYLEEQTIEKLVLYRVNRSPEDWRVYDSPSSVDSGVMTGIAESFSETNRDLRNLNIPAPGAFSAPDWSFVPYYACDSEKMAIVQRFARQKSTVDWHISRVRKSHIHSYYIHAAIFDIACIKYEDLAAEKGLQTEFVSGLNISSRVWPLPRNYNSIVVRSDHGIPHDFYVVSPHASISDKSSVALASTDLYLNVFEEMNLLILDS